MEELINYFEGLEARITALEEAQQANEATIASLEATIEELKNRPAPQPQVVEKIVEKVVEKPVEKIVERVVEKPAPAPVIEEKPSPKAAVYGKAVDDIRLAISLGDRFLYQRELFGQNAELMQRTLTELNELSSFNEALEYLAERFNWDPESNSYQQFIVTLHRRFG